MSRARSIQELEPNVVLVETETQKFYLVGTAHVSEKSAELVEETIRRYKPDAVCLELDAARLQMLTDPDGWKKTDIFQVIRSGRGYLLIAQLVLSSFQKRVASRLGTKPGDEMRRALAVSAELGIPTRMIDREIKITLKRAWRRCGWWDSFRLLFSLIGSGGSTEEITEETIEKLKDRDLLNELVDELSKTLPSIKETLIDERDSYMAAKLSAETAPSAVAVIGAGHLKGMSRKIGAGIDEAALDIVPPPSLFSKAIGYLIPGLLIALIVGGFFSGKSVGMNMVLWWILVTGTLSALGALAALAHPLSILTAFLAAPVTTLHPLLAAGWFAAMVEACIRRPQVEDFETISEDVTTFRGILRNRISKVLLVFVTANAGAALGAVLGVGTLVSKL